VNRERLDAARAAESAARTGYGRLVAHLARRSGDLAGAEDALGDALAAALEAWPRSGVPREPERWLSSVARRRLIDRGRHDALRQRPDVAAALAAVTSDGDPLRLCDDRLRLMLVCAHPAIDAAIRPALMLQAVLGLEAKAMSGAFLVSPETLTKRLVRAKAKLRANRVPFEEPESTDLTARRAAVLEAIYGAYTLGQPGALDDGDLRHDLRREAFQLAELVAGQLPTEPEALGLLALFHFVEARRPAQCGRDGVFVPLLDQDPSRWDRAHLARGHTWLNAAARRGTIGPFQLEAAIQAAHCDRARTGVVPWPEIVGLYRRLIEHHPTIGAQIGLSVAVAHASGDPRAGLGILASIDPARVRDHQPWWVALAHLQAQAGEHESARHSLDRALGLTVDPRLRRFLASRLDAL
jgi:RNA polymerase sigma-70 factor (ECF subfamily)